MPSFNASLLQLAGTQDVWGVVSIAASSICTECQSVTYTKLKHRTACVAPTACSPHVTTLRERIAVNGQPIPEAAFDALVAAQQPLLDGARAAEGGALSHFEVLTALAYRHFQDAEVLSGCQSTLLLSTKPHAKPDTISP